MRRNSLDRLLMVEVHLELAGRFLLAPLDLRDDMPGRALVRSATPRLRILRPVLGHDVARALQSGLLVGHFVLRDT